MDLFRQLKQTDKMNAQYSRSLPTRETCFNKCLRGGSSESITSMGSPKLGRYRRIPNHSECDVCHAETKDVSNLKCFHTFCTICMQNHGIVKNGCPVCNNLCEKRNGNTQVNSEKYSPEKEACNFSGDFMFGYEEVCEESLSGSESLKGLIDTMENKVYITIEDKCKNVREENDRINIETEIEVKKIKDHVDKLKKMIDKKSEMMIKHIYESKIRHSDELKRQEITLNDLLNRIKQRVKRYKQSIEDVVGNDDSNYKEMNKILSDFINISKQLVEETVHIRHHLKPMSEQSLDAVCGKIGVRVSLAENLHVNLCNTIEFPGGVHSICPIDSEKAWIGYQHFIQICSKNGEKGTKIDVGEEVHDLALDGNGLLLLACQTSIKCLNRQSELVTVFKCPGIPQCIACRENGDIVTCMGRDIDIYSREGDKVSHIAQCCKQDIKMPFKVAINVNGDICVSDYQSSNGEVSIFDKDGVMKCKIRTDAMAPRGLVCNAQGRIYVSDFRADRVNVYSIHGHFLQTIIQGTQGDSTGLSGPLSIAIDSAGDLWVGDWKRKVRVYSQTINASDDHSD